MNQNLKNDEKISIVIPAYNVEKYISDCLESLRAQTYKNLEIIVINDGSKDKTLEVISDCASRDNRIKIIDQKNSGVSKARNNGLEIATGKYIVFFDSDDFFPEDAIENLYNECKSKNADVAMCNFQRLKSGKKMGKLAKIERVYGKEEALETLFYEKYISSCCFNKIYSRKVIGDERFDEKLAVAEDFDFQYRVLKHADCVAVNNNKNVYYYIVREGSAMQGSFNKKFEKEIELCERIIGEVEKEYPKVKDAAIRRYQRAIVSCLSKCLKETGDTKEVDYLFEKLKKYPMKLTGYSNIKLFLLNNCKGGLKFIYKVYQKI